MPHNDVRRLPAATTAAAALTTAAVAAALVVAGVVPARAEAVPSTVLRDPDAADGQVTMEPAVVRAPDGQAELDIVLGARAPGDVVVELEAAVPDVAPDGVVTAGATAPDVTLSEGARLRPGERLRVHVVTSSDPVLVVAHVRAATAGPTGSEPTTRSGAGDPPVELAALVLPGEPGAAPQATVEVIDGRVVGTVTTAAPLLVTARLAGAHATTHPDRLVLPSRPLVLEGAPARWPSPSVLTITDEAGRTVNADTGRGPLVVVATALLTTALAGAAVAARAHRRRSD